MDSDFRHNLRAELDFQNLTVKELAAKTGIPKSTLDCYLGVRATMPPADIAVRIARALNVSVEFLVTGSEHACEHMGTADGQNKMLKTIIADLIKLNKTALCYTQAAIHAISQAQELTNL
ncbi:MAG: helix-turn-helix transcriptional regulator [Treponema sp.]|nr:helix-turn-helix transcriptional regulator [Treponema sp.]